MCGIAGKISFSNQAVTPREMQKMADSIAHRGPDDEGIYVSKDKKVGLGHRRLAIIDLSTAGHQPMLYLNRYWIVFNGEIYNFLDERKKLEKIGYKFKSNTDTEVIMALYDKYREKCLERLRGMFAFAIYDEKEKILFCARDRVGKKPFKYFYNYQVFIFASELKAILTQKEYHKEPDYTAIHHYLTLQYCPAPFTGFVGIKKLEPAHYLRIDILNNKIEKKRYWRLDYSEKLDLSEAEWSKKILEKLEESVKLRMISDVPLGAFLSGGIDSSAVVGLMSKFSQKPKTFSIGFEDKKYNELPYAKIIADKFNTNHTEFIIRPETIEVLPTLVKHYEEPYSDSSALPTYYLSKLTRDYVAVALNGDGGDENFAGYDRYSVQKNSLILGKAGKLVRFLTTPIANLAHLGLKTTFSQRVLRFFATLNQDYRYRYINYVCYFTNEQKAKLYASQFTLHVKGISTEKILARSFNLAKTADKMDQTLFVDFINYLPEDLLAKVDIATMAVGLEGRSPFLDHELLELTTQIPFNLKLKGFNNKKYILKKALRGFIPDEVMYRPKQGFGVPINRWFKEDLNQYLKKILLGKGAYIAKLFNQDYIKQIIETHQNTDISFANQLWALLSLELWFNEFFS